MLLAMMVASSTTGVHYKEAVGNFRPISTVCFDSCSEIGCNLSNLWELLRPKREAVAMLVMVVVVAAAAAAVTSQLVDYCYVHKLKLVALRWLAEVVC